MDLTIMNMQIIKSVIVLLRYSHEVIHLVSHILSVFYHHNENANYKIVQSTSEVPLMKYS